MIGVVVGVPDLSRASQCTDDVTECFPQALCLVGNFVFLAQGLDKRNGLIEIVTRHGGEKTEEKTRVMISQSNLGYCMEGK